MKNIFKTLVVTVFGLLFFQLENVSAADNVTVDIAPQTVQIGTFYNGTTVTISGSIPAGAEAVIRLSGAGEDLHLKRKGKVGGVLWMNVGDLTYHNAPNVYKLLTDASTNDLDNSAARNYGFTALKNRIEISPDNGETDFLLKEFVRLKTEDGMYGIMPGTISYGAAEGGMKSYTGTIDIPPGMTQGAYAVDVVAVQNDTIVGTSSSSLNLKQIGFPEQLSAMAFGHALWYGIMSVVIALMAGLFMGLMFKDKGGAH
ncbi:MAG: TIGR02186 family protein [Desulfobulbaceae bacterium]|nr:TIGR02186 family protein [Desulfobulbaceae bacterium]